MLPLSRNETATTDGPVLSETINDIQDCIIAGAHGERVLTISPYAGFVSDVAGNFTVIGDTGYIESTGALRLLVPIPVAIGERIKSAKFARYGNGSADFLGVNIQRFNAGTLDTLGASGAVDDTPAAWNTTTITVASPVAAVTGDSFHLEFIFSATGLRLGSIEVTLDQPL